MRHRVALPGYGGCGDGAFAPAMPFSIQ